LCKDCSLLLMHFIVACGEQMAQFCFGGRFLMLMNEQGR
jgi:hypothetical protein